MDVVDSINQDIYFEVIVKEFKMTLLDLLTDINYNATWWARRIDTSTYHTNGFSKLHSLSPPFKALANGKRIQRSW